MLKSFRYLLLPFSLVYGGVVWLRNLMFDKEILKSSNFNFPLICVGNLAVGGTGKTPMVEYLIRLLSKQYNTATLSRGYKRKTEGFAIANDSTTALEIGDEPMQFHQKFPEITVAVGEERLVAIPQLLHDKPNTQVIILDDAFQHRVVRAGLNILLTEYKNLYTRDLMLPAGDLRDIRLSSKRAQIIIVSKCKPDLSEIERQALIHELHPLPEQYVFFTQISYGKPYHLFSKLEFEIKADTEILLVCGIANPRPLKDYLTARVQTYDMLRYPDHHIFSIDDLDDIRRQFDKMSHAGKIILTTEKDATRLQKFESELTHLPIYALPIEHNFLFNEAPVFNALVTAFIERVKIFSNQQ
ncbi:MAG: tetraacyldisaccharide 4'-kinase [Sphingobacteriales bacterium]|nr:tetraacyldisaccharide 4'-kinase [Sphingobacteriales bacterium]